MRRLGPVQRDLRRRARLGVRHRQRDRIEAESGIERIGQRLDAFAQQPHHRGGIARRPPGVDRQPSPRAIAAIQPHDKPPPAQIAQAHLARHAVQKLFDGVKYVVGARQRLGKAQFGADRRDRAARRDRAVHLAQHRAQPPHRVRAKPRRDRRHRPPPEIAQRGQPRPAQAGQRRLGQIERRDGKIIDIIAMSRALPHAVPGKRPRRGGMIGRRHPRRKRDGPAHPTDQRRLPAEQMRRAGDIEDQPVGRIGRDMRGEPQHRRGQIVEQTRRGGGIVRRRGQIGKPRARIGQRHPRPQPARLRHAIDRAQPQRAARPRHQHERRMVRKIRRKIRPRAMWKSRTRRLRHQPGKPYRQIAPARLARR